MARLQTKFKMNTEDLESAVKNIKESLTALMEAIDELKNSEIKLESCNTTANKKWWQIWMWWTNK